MTIIQDLILIYFDLVNTPFRPKDAGAQCRHSLNYRFEYQGQFAEKDEETGTSAFTDRSFDSKIGRWATIDPDVQFHSPYLGMANNPINAIDKDGAFVHVLIGGLIGGGAAIAKMALEPGPINWRSSSTWKHIGVGVGSGMLIAAIPATAGALVGGARAGFIAAGASITDQVIDNRKINAKETILDGLVSAVSFGVGSHLGRHWRNAAILRNWVGPLNRSGILKSFYNNPSLPGIAASAAADIGFNALQLQATMLNQSMLNQNFNFLTAPRDYSNLTPSITFGPLTSTVIPNESIQMNLPEHMK